MEKKHLPLKFGGVVLGTEGFGAWGLGLRVQRFGFKIWGLDSVDLRLILLSNLLNIPKVPGPRDFQLLRRAWVSSSDKAAFVGIAYRRITSCIDTPQPLPSHIPIRDLLYWGTHVRLEVGRCVMYV